MQDSFDPSLIEDVSNKEITRCVVVNLMLIIASEVRTKFLSV